MARFRRQDAGMTVATIAAEPDRHALVMPACVCGMCAPTWARRRGKSRRFTQPVTPVAAMEKEGPAARPAMVEEHRACLEAMVCAVDRLIGATTRDDPGRTGAGLARRGTGQPVAVGACLDASAGSASQKSAVFSRWTWTGPNDGAVSVVSTHGWLATVSGMPLPPDSPARMSW
jgi:hypothetical protein